MTNVRLQEVVVSKIKELLDASSKECVYQITKISKGNGVGICIKEAIHKTDGTTEYYQMGYNLKVYGIAGEEAVEKAIENRYRKLLVE